jgi:hypothetical protein
MPRPVGSFDPRMAAWRRFIVEFGLDPFYVHTHAKIFSIAFAEQMERCADNDCRKLLLGIKEAA